MARKYLPIYPDFEELTEELTDAELGGLLRAMLGYFYRGDSQTKPDGNARFVWPVARRTLDQCIAKAEEKQRNGALGGRPLKTNENQTKPDETKENQTEPNDAQENQTAYARAREQKQKQKHTQKQDQDQTQTQTQSAREPAAPAATPSAVPAGEAETLAAGIPRYQRADELARRYNLPDCDPSRDALLEDFETYGEQAVEDALREACASNSRAKLSVKFYRAVLARGQPGATPYAGASNGPPRTNNVFAELLRREGGGGA